MSNPDITRRFLECVDHLVNKGLVKSRRQFALSVHYHVQGMSEMAAGRRDVPLELIDHSFQTFRINPVYLLTGSGPFILDRESDGLRIQQLSIVTDQNGNERIVHVPVAAQAGYGQWNGEPVFVQELPSYQLPDPQFNSGTYRSFEIAGSSMEPTFYSNDIVIASFLEPRFWMQALRNNEIYIIVTREDVFIKRIINQLKEKQKIECRSDNPEYHPFGIEATEIVEIWRVRMKMTAHLESPGVHGDAFDIQLQLRQQHALLESLQQKLSHVTHT